MKIIFKITRTELRNLFYSPVAWFLIIVFLIQCAIFYTYSMVPMAKWQDIMMSNNPKFKPGGPSLTAIIFLSPGNGIIGNVLQNLYLFVPLLTMGLISREINNGSIKLLYSSPIKIRHIVLGKYLAIMIYNLLLVGIVGIFMVSAAFNIVAVDYGLLLSAALGFYLLVCAYTAIGLFMSSLTTYQVVSAIGTFIIIFVLGRIGGLWQKYDFIRDLTYFLSMVGRTGKLMRGLVTTKDVLYFLVIVYIFLSFAMLKLRSGRESSPWYVKAAKYVAVIVSALAIGYITSLPALTGYWDTTARKTNTLRPATQKILKELGDDPLEVTLYTNLLGPVAAKGLPEARNNYLSTVWENYIRFKPGIKFSYEYYYNVKKGDSSIYRGFPGKTLKHIAGQMADGYNVDISLFKTPEEIRKIADLEPENLRTVMQLKYKDRSVFVRTFNDNQFWPEEMHMAAAFKRLLQAKLPKVYFMTGDLERNIYKGGEREFELHSTSKLSRYSLVNLGFDADTISLDTQDIPADITALVLADPKTELGAVSINKLNQYIANGGNLFILGEPGKQQILNPLLGKLGVQLMPGNLVQPSAYEMPHMLTPYLTPASAYLSEDPHLLGLRESIQEKDYDTLTVQVPGATGISIENNAPFTVKPLLSTVAEKSWLKMGPLVVDSAQVVFTPQDGDVRAAFPVAVQLTRQVNNKEQRIIVCSDADFMSNMRNGGGFMGTAIYSWLDYNVFPIYDQNTRAKDTKLNISAAMANVLIIVYVWILPALVLLTGIVLLLRRKRK
ncbi:Gldg family protein [Chitinophaga sp.]|uniref:Gldg family protein n=1 Tax=Chitinophaga sp. TaxID=1869181 RepID=UPI002C8EF6F3|nr:Gldg family protein [Chitinophaga sp.]HWV65366.1 Gldg family protein [Chitinophaga sp.]